MDKTQIEVVFDLTKECPECGKTELTEADKGSIFFKNKCRYCCDKETK